MITIDEQFIEAEIYKQIPTKSGLMYLAKVSFIDAGLYISGITIRKSPKEPNEWWVQLPAYSSGKGGYIKPFEADQSKPLWLALQEKVLAALKQYVQEDEVVTDFDQDKPINLNDLPF